MVIADFKPMKLSNISEETNADFFHGISSISKTRESNFGTLFQECDLNILKSSVFTKERLCSIEFLQELSEICPQEDSELDKPSMLSLILDLDSCSEANMLDIAIIHSQLSS